MIGAIAGDIIGSVHEYAGTKSTTFELFEPECRFTDDTVLTVAVADCLMTSRPYRDAFREYFRAYPQAGYGMRFTLWAASDSRPAYNSWGNGSAMRVSPVGYACESLEAVVAEAQRSAAVTHNHAEGIRGAQATAVALFRARQGEPKRQIKAAIERQFGYDLGGTLEALRPGYRFDESCQGTVPAALLAFLESESYEEAVRQAISLGGDADTLACIAGAIAEAYYGGVPEEIARQALARLDERLRSVTLEFCQRFNIRTA